MIQVCRNHAKHNISPSRFFPHNERYEIFDGKIFLHENLVEKIKIFAQYFVPIRTALRNGTSNTTYPKFKAAAEREKKTEKLCLIFSPVRNYE